MWCKLLHTSRIDVGSRERLWLTLIELFTIVIHVDWVYYNFCQEAIAMDNSKHDSNVGVQLRRVTT